MSDDTPTPAEALAFLEPLILRTPSTDVADAFRRVRRVVAAAQAYVDAHDTGTGVPEMDALVEAVRGGGET